MTERIFLKCENVYLRGLQESDIYANYVNWLNDEEVCRNNGHHIFPYSEKQAVEYIDFANKTKDALILAIVTNKGNVHIGNIALQNINYIHRTADFAIIMGEKEYWGKGYSKEAARLIVNHGFSALNLHRINIGTTKDNDPMQKLAIGMGFAKEGVRRKALFKNNVYVDIIEYGLLKSEWEGES